MMTYPEERVLQHLDPVPEDVNEWPDFALREVKIFYQGKGRYADLLEASDETPLCVLGELMPLDDEQEHLTLIDEPMYARIKIDNVVNYSFGQDDSGRPVIWAAGKAGWYEITPSDRYLNHYHDTIEAIDLFYFMVDQHQKLPRKHQKLGFRIDPFLTEYQKHTDYRIDDDDEAMETIHKHHRFLLKQMIEEREGIDWSQTYLWKHLLETYGEEVEVLRATLAQLDASMVESHTEESESEQEVGNQEVEEDEEEEVDERGRELESPAVEDSEQSAEPSQESSSSESEPEAVEEEPMRDWTKTIWDLLNVLRKSANFDMRQCGIEKLADELRKLSDSPRDHKAAVAGIERSAAPLLRFMNEAKLRKKFNWSTRTIYDELEATLADEVAEEVMKTPAAKSGKQRHRMKSVLRPSGASKARKRTRGVPDSQDEDEMGGEPPTSSPVARRNPLPRPATARQTREATADSAASREDSPSRQLNGHYDPDGLPELPPGPEAQEMLDLVAKEARMVGRQHQTSHLQAFLGSWPVSME